jgi:hypothetical protein
MFQREMMMGLSLLMTLCVVWMILYELGHIYLLSILHSHEPDSSDNGFNRIE